MVTIISPEKGNYNENYEDFNPGLIHSYIVALFFQPIKEHMFLKILLIFWKWSKIHE